MSSAEDVARKVARMSLLGAPRTIVLDEESLGTEGSEVGTQVRRLLAALGLDVVTLPLGALSVDGPSVAVLGQHHPPVNDCYGWYVGPGNAPPWMHATTAQGPRMTARILALLGTGFAQERAGAAFRAASAGQPAPTTMQYASAAILSGVTDAVGSPARSRAPAPHPVEVDATSRRELLMRSAFALKQCCAENGAIAAAPRGLPGEPDYWFCWQRDAAHTALALHALAGSDLDDETRGWARSRALGYVDFVAGLGPALRDRDDAGFSRCTMAGVPVDGYGDPQPDGPAATCLAVMAVGADPRTALDVARPYLDFLVEGGAQRPSFDLWELTVGTSFHAANLARRALRRAAQLARTTGDPSAHRYRDAAAQHSRWLQDFYDSSRNHFVHVRGPTPHWFAATSQLDISIIGSTLLDYDVTDDVLNVDDPRVATTIHQLEQHFTPRWPVNAAWREAGNLGAGLGRFPEDCNDGLATSRGNPWPVATLWAAQYHARRAQRAHYRAVASYDYQHNLFLARAYLSFVLAHTDPTSISEQIDAATRAPRGARPLAWAHAEMITTLLAFDAVPPG